MRNKERPQTARTSAELHESIAGIASDYPGMWRSLSERGTVRRGDSPSGSGNKKPSRFELAEKRIMQQRDAKQKSDYRRLLKDRLVTLKRKDIFEAKKQMFREKGAKHAERVRNIKIKQQVRLRK